MSGITVIIPSRNRCELLERTLLSVSSCETPKVPVEIIVIDNGSTDRTPTVLEGLQKLDSRIRPVKCEIPGLHIGRNLGAKLASYDVLCYLDDDVVLNPNYLCAVESDFLSSSYVIASGNCIPEYEKSPPTWLKRLWKTLPDGSRVLGAYSLLDFGGEGREISSEYVWGCNFIVRKDALANVGGFVPDGMPQDMVIFRGNGECSVTQKLIANGNKALFIPGASLRHFVPASRMTKEYLLKRSWRQGISDSYSLIRREGCCSKEMLRDKRCQFWIRKMRLTVKKVLMRQTPFEGYLFASYSEGFLFHYEQAIKSTKLLEWICLKNYQEADARNYLKEIGI